jgi:predicted patatin/cPLA2 family phospholipase
MPDDVAGGAAQAVTGSMGNALVVEGGGMRGVFAAGLLDRFIEAGFDPFDAYFGVSAGACNLASFCARQHGRSRRSYTRHMLDPRCFSLLKFLRGGHYMDLDWLWDFLDRHDPLDSERASAKNLFVVSTNFDTGRPVCTRAGADTLPGLLKGSSALPLLYRGFVEVGGVRLVDGGVADSIPAATAIARGARRVMVVRSQPDGYRKDSFVESRVVPLLFRRNPPFARALRARGARYNAQADRLKDPPDGVEIIEVCPAVLRSGRTTRDLARLEADYDEGRRAGLDAIRRWG